jgi:hypothetical protein
MLRTIYHPMLSREKGPVKRREEHPLAFLLDFIAQ